MHTVLLLQLEYVWILKLYFRVGYYSSIFVLYYACIVQIGGWAGTEGTQRRAQQVLSFEGIYSLVYLLACVLPSSMHSMHTVARVVRSYYQSRSRSMHTLASSTVCIQYSRVVVLYAIVLYARSRVQQYAYQYYAYYYAYCTSVCMYVRMHNCTLLSYPHTTRNPLFFIIFSRRAEAGSGEPPRIPSRLRVIVPFSLRPAPQFPSPPHQNLQQ